MHFFRPQLDPNLTSESAQRLAAALHGRAKLGDLTPLLEALDAGELAWLAASAIEALAGGPTDQIERVAWTLVRHSGRVTLAWERGSAVSFVTASAHLKAISGGIQADLVALFIEASLALDPAQRMDCANGARQLLQLGRAMEPDAHSSIPAEDLLTLSCLAGDETDREEMARQAAPGQRLNAIELAAIASLPVALRACLSSLDRYWDEDMARRQRRARAARELASNAGYEVAVHEVLAGVDARLADLHAGRIQYAADKAFGAREVVSASRAFGVASAGDPPWFGALASRLLPRLVIAPNASKTLPSQALAIAFARTTTELPTPETVAALAEALRIVRHAGIKKKLERELRQARKNLAATGRMVPRARDGKTAAAASKRELTAFRTALDASFEVAPRPFDPWLRQLLADPVLGPPAASVIWDVHEPAGVRSGIWRRDHFETADGAVFQAGGSAVVRPWHPVESPPAERASWQAFVLGQRISQPIRQAFREWYVPPPAEMDGDRTRMFAGIAVSVRPLLGLARREGWRTEYGERSLRRQLASGWGFELLTDSAMFPGVEDRVTLEHVRVQRFDGHGWQPVRLADVPPVVLSEGLRSVDLLASTSAIGRDQSAKPEALAQLEGLPLSGQTNMRRAVLEAVLATVPGAERITFEGRFLRVRAAGGCYRVHYGTGFVVKPSGEVVANAEEGRALALPLPWLPYDEALLELIVRRVLGLLEATQAA